MRNYWKTVLLLAVLLCPVICPRADAQRAGHSFGVKIGNLIAADYQCSFSAHHALDITAGVVNAFKPSYQFMLVSAAWHYNFFIGQRGLTPYAGAGLSTGVQFGHWNARENSRITYFLSADVPIGVEYTLNRKPVVFCLEWCPKIQFVNYLRFVPQSIAVGVRFILPRMR